MAPTCLVLESPSSSNPNYRGQGHVPPGQLPKAPSSPSLSISRDGEYPFSKGCFLIKCYLQSPAIWVKALHKRRGKINIIFQQHNGRFPLPKYFGAIFAQSQKNLSPKEREKEKHIRQSYECLNEGLVGMETSTSLSPWAAVV